MRLPMFPATPPGTPAAPPIAREELLNLLSTCSCRLPRPRGRAGTAGHPAGDRGDRRQRGQLSVGQADEDVINVVAMFFDLILDDRNLPIEIQALVSRLQLPILKVALKDRSFSPSESTRRGS